MTKGQLAAVVDGPWQDIFAIRALREGYGAIDRRPIEPSEFIGEADDRWPVVAERAAAIVSEYLSQLINGGPQRLYVVSSLVRGLLVRPELAADLIAGALVPAAPLGGNQRFKRVVASGTFNVGGDRGAPEALEPEPKRVVAPPDWVEAACVMAAEGTDYAYTSPGSLLPELEPTLLERAALAVGLRQDPYEPVLRAALRGHEGDRFTSEDVCRFVGADVTRRNETGRIKRVLEKLGWTKKEFDDGGERYRAYARAS